MNLLKATDITKKFGDHTILDRLSLEIKEGQCIGIIGKSGRGKTTLLNILSGVDNQFKGEVEGKISMKSSLDKAYIYQGLDQLFPWKSVKKNIELPMMKRKLSPEDIKDMTERLLRDTELTSHEDKYPAELSGGMKQRAVLARAIGYSPKIIMLDEPFSHLDDIIKERLQDLLINLKKTYKLTMVFVTHDLNEAIRVSDKIMVMGEEIKTFEIKEEEKIKASKEYWRIYEKLFDQMT